MTTQKSSPFQELSHAIFAGDILDVHIWFKHSGFETDSQLRACLSKHIINSPYFFSFSSNLFNRESLEKETLKRQLPVLSYFNLQEQLSILSSSSMNEDIHIEHFKVLNYSKDVPADRQAVLKDLGMHQQFTNLFNKEDFGLMQKIEEQLGLDIKNNRMDKVAIHYDFPNKGAFNLNDKKYNSCPLDDIIFNYSQVKENYFKSNSLELPSFSYVNSLKEKILQEIKESPYFNTKDYSEKVEDKVENYFTHYRYTLLSKSLSLKPEVYKKSTKI